MYYANYCPYGTRMLCTYDLHVFPTRAARDEWVSDDPSERVDGERESISAVDARHFARGSFGYSKAVTHSCELPNWPSELVDWVVPDSHIFY